MRASSLLLLTLLACPVGRAEEPKVVVKPDAFPTLVNPNCSHCVDEAKRRGGELRDDDPVLCLDSRLLRRRRDPDSILPGEAPRHLRQLRRVRLRPDAGIARGFAPSYNFVFHGWRNGDHGHQGHEGRHALLGPLGRRVRRTAEGRATEAGADAHDATGAGGSSTTRTRSPTTCSTSTSRSSCRRRRMPSR